MKKRESHGQISVFVIIGIVIVLSVVVVMFLTLRDNQTVKQFISRQSVSSEILPVYEAVNDCFRQRSVDAIRIVGLQGGYVNLPSDYLETSISDVSYGYFLGKNTLPSKEKIESEINSYIKLTLPFCMYRNDNEEYNTTIKKPLVTTKISKDRVDINAKMPISLTKNNKTFSLDNNYETSFSIKLGDMIDVANKIIEKEKISENYIPVEELLKYDYNIVFSYIDNNNLFYIINDPKSKIENISYSFIFGVKIK